MLVASLAAGPALFLGSQSAFAGPAEKTHVITVKPIARTGQTVSSGSRISTGPNNTVTVHVGSGSSASGAKRSTDHTVSLMDQNGKTIYYNNPHAREVIGMTADGQPIYGNFFGSVRTYQRVNKDHSVDVIHESRRKDGSLIESKVEHYKNAPPPRHVDLGSCPPWGC